MSSTAHTNNNAGPTQPQPTPVAERRDDIYLPLMPLSYTGPVPRPLPPCTDPTPDEQLKVELRLREEALKLKEAEQQQQRKAVPEAPDQQPPSTEDETMAAAALHSLRTSATGAAEGLRSLYSRLSISAEKASADVAAAAHTQVRAMSQQQGYDRFAAAFGEDLVKGQGEVLLADYSCTAMHNGTRVEGYLFVTRNYVCFASPFNSFLVSSATEAVRRAVAKAIASSSTATAATTEGGADVSSASAGASGNTHPQQQQPRVVGIRQIIPLASIASIVPSVALPTRGGGSSNSTDCNGNGNGAAPYFLPCPADYVVPTALQIFDKDSQKLYQFLQFGSMIDKAGAAVSSLVRGTPLDRALNYLDHAWREAVTVPLQGVDYAPQ